MNQLIQSQNGEKRCLVPLSCIKINWYSKNVNNSQRQEAKNLQLLFRWMKNQFRLDSSMTNNKSSTIQTYLHEMDLSLDNSDKGFSNTLKTYNETSSANPDSSESNTILTPLIKLQ